MVLQSTGAISFNNIQTEFGGANPIGINEYYLNGTYTTGTGATGIPTSGTISVNNFYGKSKVVGAVVPAAVATSFVGTYANAYMGGVTNYEAITGCSGSNTSRTGVSTFNNIGTLTYLRSNVIYHANLILQARVGDQINIYVNIISKTVSPHIVRIYRNFGTGYVNIYSSGYVTGNGGTYGTSYTIPVGTVAGNYGICCTNEYSTSGQVYRSVNYYSLHIF